MIAYLSGQVLKKLDKDIILENAGIGYLVHTPLQLIAELTEGQNLELFIHHHIREDANELFGLKNFDQLIFFKQLIQISGVGPKMALEIINFDINKIKHAILNEDSTAICKIPGVGQKTAKRIILELKNKIELEDLPNQTKAKEEKIHTDAIEALIRLGYQKHQITRSLRDMPEELVEAQAVITYFLKNV